MGLFLSSAHLYGENNSLQFAFYTDCDLLTFEPPCATAIPSE